MIKYIGIMLALIGIALFIAETVLARKNGIKEAASELSLILGSGYAATHKEEKRRERPDSVEPVAAEIKASPRKRTLSKEAQEILEKVEQERAEERKKDKPSLATDGTGMMPMKRNQKKAEQTDILKRTDEEVSTSQKTDILKRNKGPATDILGKRDVNQEKKDLLKKQSTQTDTSTDILSRRPAKGSGTDILNRKPENESNTDILHRSKPDKTDVLRKGKTNSSTDILQKTAIKTEKNDTDILERR